MGTGCRFWKANWVGSNHSPSPTARHWTWLRCWPCCRWSIYAAASVTRCFPDAVADWTVKTADGVVRDMSTFLQGIGEQASTGSEFVAQFRQRWVSGWNAWYVNNGYTIGGDGVARRALSSMTTVGILESRRWRDGERGLRAANDTAWRMTA